MGHNGGPDWRALLAGEDTKALETVSRYQSPNDLMKAFLEQRAALSKRAEPAKLPDSPTPEQLGEWRKGLGLPEIAKDAKPDDFMKAYKIEAPQGYDLNEVEKGMLGDYAKLAYEQGHSPREVKSAVDFFFKQQTAQQQVINRANDDFHKTEHNALRDKLGSKEYEAQKAAATTWIAAQFTGEDGTVDQLAMNNVLNAQMPGGGRLGDSAFLFNLAAKMALGEGYGDRIEANALESSGKSIVQQINEIDKLLYTDRAAYDEAAKPGGRLEKLLSAGKAQGVLDELGNEKRRRSA